jgi:4-hydroxy-2-oxoheptanedioate aldolase
MDIRHPIDPRLPGVLRGAQRLRGVFNGLPSPSWRCAHMRPSTS